MDDRKIYLTSGEISVLWTAYMSDSMSERMLEFMLKDIEDAEIKKIIQTAYNISVNHLEQLRLLMKKNDFAIPNGFTENDVNMKAPWLYTDIFCLDYVGHMAKVGMVSYSAAVSMCTREDVRDYFTQCLTETANLYNQATETALSKGLKSRHPYMEAPKETDYVDDKKYLSGLNPFSEKRALNNVEISHLYLNVLTNSIGVKLCLSFAQTSPTKEVQDFMLRGRDISKKHIKLFTSILLQEDLETPQLPDVGISNSTQPSFSDKLMMFHMSLISSAGIGNYATAAAASQRTDLAVNYERLSLEVSGLAKSGADIMIKNNWLEQPPGMKNREKLAREKS